VYNRCVVGGAVGFCVGIFGDFCGFVGVLCPGGFSVVLADFAYFGGFREFAGVWGWCNTVFGVVGLR